MDMLQEQKVDVMLATTDNRNSDYEYLLIKTCETVLAVEKNHPLIKKAQPRKDFLYPYIIMAVFFTIPFLLTQAMSNLATLTIFISLVTSACLKIGIDPRAAVVGVLTASCISIMTPMAAHAYDVSVLLET